MNRRQLLALTVAIPLAATMAWGAGLTTYTPEGVKAELAAGKVVVLDFSASWCPSCQAQGRTIEKLRAENPGYVDRLAFFLVDWDTYKDSELAKTYGVTSRGSLVLLKGDKVVTQTYSHSTRDALKAMFDEASA